MSDLPENNRIQKLLTIEEIAAMMDSGDYSAEMLLQHLCVHWNRRDEWQPIDTAPKDGTVIDLWVPGEFAGRYTDAYFGKPPHECGEMGSYCDSDWHSAKPGWVCGTFGEFICTMNPPTHWQPQPKPPSEKIRE